MDHRIYYAGGNGLAETEADDEKIGRELWMTNKAAAGTSMTQDINQGHSGAQLSEVMTLAHADSPPATGPSGEGLAGEIARIGDEILVNTTNRRIWVTGSSDKHHDIAALEGGGFAVTWDEGDTADYAVRAQVFDAQGIPVADELLVNTTNEERQYAPAIAALTDGGFAITWEDSSRSGGDASATAVRAQVFDKDGRPIGGELLVNTTTEKSQISPKISALSDGGFVVTWMDVSATGGDTSGTAVRAQVFGSDGTALGDEILVNTTTENNQTGPQLTSLIGGGFAITWNDYSEEDGGGIHDGSVRAQVFTADGTRIGNEIPVNTATYGRQLGPVITSLGDNGFLIIWYDAGNGSEEGIRAQLFTADGMPVGEELVISASDTRWEAAVSYEATALTNGGFVISWTARDSTGGDVSGSAVWATVFSPDGIRIKDKVLVNTTTDSNQGGGEIISLVHGGFVIAWTDASQTGDDTSGSAVRAQVFTSDGTAVGNEFLVNSTTEEEQNRPNITALPNGNFVVTFEDLSGIDGSTMAVRAQVFEVAEGSVNAVPRATGDDTILSAGDSIPLADLFDWSDADGADDILAFAVEDSNEGGGYLTINGERVEEGVVHDDMPIETIGNWAFVAGAETTSDTIAFRVIDEAGAFNQFWATAKVTSEGGSDLGEPSPINTYPLALSAPQGWDDDDAGGVANADGGVAFLGHAKSTAAFLRIENGRVAIAPSGRVEVDGDIYAMAGRPDRPLFTGSFAIEPGALSATEFYSRSDGYGLLNDLVDIDFSSLTFSKSDVSFGADLDFPLPFDALDTSGGPLTMRFGTEGLSFGPGRIGTSDWFPDIELPLSGGSLMDLTFSDLGVDYDDLSNSLYFSGEAALIWGGTIKDHFGALAFVPLQEMVLDLAGERSGDALFERGEKYLRLQHDDGDLAWDLVGNITYSSTAGFLRELSLGLDTIEQTFKGSVTGALSFAADQTVTGALSGTWDPIAIDGVRFKVDGLNIPVATTGLFLRGGALEVEGLSGSPSDDMSRGTIYLVQRGITSKDSWLDTFIMDGPTYSGEVAYTYGNAAYGLPAPFRGDIDGSFSSESVDGSFSIRSTPGFLLGDAASGGIISTVERYFGVDPSTALDFDILAASGKIEADFVNNSLNVGLDASVLGGLFNGSAELTMYKMADVHNINFDARGRLQIPDTIPLIGGRGVDGHIKAEYSADATLSNDFIAAWTIIDLGIAEYDFGLELTFDGNFRLLNSDDIELIGSWELGPDMEVAVMSAEWEAAREDAELIVITPDGTRLSEADIAARDDIAIAPGLTTDTSRHVALKTPDSGIWDIEMVALDGLGEVTYSASSFNAGPTLAFVIGADDREAELADLTVTAQGLTAESEIILNALEKRDSGAGVRLDVDALQSEDGMQSVQWDYSTFDPGTYYLEAVARGGGVAPETAIAKTSITVDAEIGGTVKGTKGAPLSDAILRFTVDGEKAATGITNLDGTFRLRAPPDTAGQISVERSVTSDDTAQITASDALEALRLTVGLEPSWGPADGFDFVAADFNGDGSVTAYDALDILRQAVGLDTDKSAPRWVFADMQADGVDADNVPTLDNQMDIAALTADTQMNLQGILVGHMEDYV